MANKNKRNKRSIHKTDKSVLLVAIVVIILDQLTKYLIKSNLTLHQKIPLTSFFQITYTTNSGAGFSILQNFRWFFIIFTVIFLYFIYRYYLTNKKSPRTKYLDFCVGLLVGGALGNFIDRLFLGHVTDFLDFSFWPTFNIADSAVSIAAVLIIIWLWKN